MEALDLRLTSNKKYRFERKYLINRDDAYVLAQRVSRVMRPDSSHPDGRYHISSLYFDDMYNTSLYEKLSGVVERDKFRVRFYNGNQGFMRLERKHKRGEYIFKESETVTQEQFQMMCHSEYQFMRQGVGEEGVFNEFYASHTLKRMRPSVMVDYNREAYMYRAGNVRITFDSDVSASMMFEKHSKSVLPHSNVILEVKYNNFLPSVINGLLTGITSSQQLAISKFVMAKLGLQGRTL